MERNTIIIEIEGQEVDGKKTENQKVGFKCGTLAVAIACQSCDAASVQELLKRLASKELLATLSLLYGAACQFGNKKAPEFTMDMMSDITERMTEEQSKQVAEVLLQRFKPKNAPAPEQPGVK